jgi:hypothetical protein
MPLRMMEGKFPSGPNYAADRTRYSRYKTVVKTIQSGIPADACVAQTPLAFSRGWRSLASYLKSRHGIDCDPESAPSTLYTHVVALPAFAPPEVRSVHAQTLRRPLEEVLQEHMANLDTSEASGAAACIRREIQSSLHSDRRFGYLNTQEHWPKPTNAWQEGAVHCAKCVSCDKYFDTAKAIRSHLLVHMNSAERENFFRADSRGSWIYTAPSTKWCVALTLPNTVRSRFVPVSKDTAALPFAGPAVPPHVSAGVAACDVLKCCCGAVFSNIASLTRHHNGIVGGKRPRNAAHDCTSDCVFARGREAE